MRAYLPAATFSAAFLAWLFWDPGGEAPSGAPTPEPRAEVRVEVARVETTGSVEAAPEAARRAVRIVYPAPYEAR